MLAMSVTDDVLNKGIDLIDIHVRKVLSMFVTEAVLNSGTDCNE